MIALPTTAGLSFPRRELARGASLLVRYDWIALITTPASKPLSDGIVLCRASMDHWTGLVLLPFTSPL